MKERLIVLKRLTQDHPAPRWLSCDENLSGCFFHAAGRESPGKYMRIETENAEWEEQKVRRKIKVLGGEIISSSVLYPFGLYLPSLV